MKKILAVDNNRHILRIITEILEKEGHQVATAEDGLNALDILKKYTPDVIFVDLVMPNIDGKMLCKIIRGMPKLKDVYIVILSATTAEELIDTTQLGANALIAKGPIKEMAQHIRYVLDKPDLASSQCLSGEILGIKNVNPRVITEELLSIKRHFEIVLERMSEGILEINSEGRIISINSFALSLLNKPEEKLLGSYFIDLFSKDDRQRVLGLMKIKNGKPKRITEDASIDLNGNQIILNILPLSNADESTSIIILSDVSERKHMQKALQKAYAELEQLVEMRTAKLRKVNEQLKREIGERKQAEDQIKASLKEKEILLQEIHHRVKNNMQVISSLLHLQASGVGDERAADALMECRGRVQAMAFVHETLYGSDTLAVIDFKTYISKVANQIFQTDKISMDRVKLEVDAEDIKLGIEQATPLGLITNELLSNSLKYAFPENRSGEIVIRMRAGEQDSIEFVFSDNGIGIPEGLDWRNTDSLGLRLVIILADQLDGTVSLDRGKGTHFTVRFRHEENQ